MKRKLLFTLSLLLIVFNSFSQDFVKRDGKKLKYQGNEIYLRGMAFGNLVYDDNLLPSQHHSEVDFRRVKDLGMNAIRFYMNYKTFEDDATPFVYKQSGWNWIDQNIQWAKKNGIFLILNMHIPQGGFQSRCEGTLLWSELDNQKRLAALWKAIAERYKNEPQIAGYDLLNEPTPSGSIENWSILAQAIIDSIRTIDNNHLIITERAIALDCNFGFADENNNYPQITEENLMYTVHLYDPFEFTHQNLSWAGTGEGGKYPDENLFSVPLDLTYATGHYANPSIKTGTSDWSYFAGTPYTVTGDSLLVGRVVFIANKINNGKVYFDDFVLKELDANSNEIRTIYSTTQFPGPFWYYSSDKSGYYLSTNTGHNDNSAAAIAGNQADASLTCPDFTFMAVKGHKYVVSGWMKGENIPSGASAYITTQFFYSPSKAKTASRNYNSLVEKITAYSEYIEGKGFPVYFGEFGAARTCFVDDKGGDRWAADAMHIFDSLGYHFTYHAYKESSFGLYDGWEKPVDTTTINKALEKVFREFFGTSITGILPSDNEVKSSLLLYPNPGSDYLNIGNPEQLNISKIEICDLFGNIVISSENTSKLDIHSLPKGSYIILMHHAGGVSHGKWIKQ